MIDKNYGKFTVCCDGCPDTLEDQEFESFDEARDAMKEEGWVTRKLGDIWINLCAKCAKKEEK